VLDSEPARSRLLERVAGVDRLVLLGDLIELRQGPPREALRAAEPVLDGLGDAVGAAGEAVIVPGNHDHDLIEPWLTRASRLREPDPLGLSSEVDWRAGETLATIARRLGPASVRVLYPGVWLRDDVYATHGHYCDRHTTVPMFERLGAGAMARIVREPDRGPRSAEDYERVLAPIYAWISAIAAGRGPELGRSSHGPSARAWGALSRPRRDAPGRGARLRSSVRRGALRGGFGLAVAAINRLGLGPVRADLSTAQLRRASLVALDEVAMRLEVDAGWVIFGHSHRAGPLADDERSEWRTRSGAAIMNSGCWVHERAFLGPDPARSPYRAGFAVELGDTGAPELVNLLD
jgi:predicted phosphodiesterase